MIMAIVYLGIGSNIGNKEHNCEEAIKRLKNNSIKIAERSSLYETKPVGGPPQENYLNGVVKIETELSPEHLMGSLKEIEKYMGRVSSERNHPRVIDLDILFYDDLVVSEENLVIPHPGMQDRCFVLRGLAEIAPEVAHPVLGKTVRELYETVIATNTTNAKNAMNAMKSRGQSPRSLRSLGTVPSRNKHI